ncbi:seed biotin-containing protein SBP65-like [Impatiens glandulifera]|uniref:seed biotin-containing protein SBP65-like n=1 Tax=Impatiens glandulifera TaxID=253017 RepID=UPI001FB19FE3|nr:seed biotin-containing protein SBP65-like [Impatiens glandulifera]
MASEQLRREDVVEKHDQSLEKNSVEAHTGVVTRIATHFESLHDENQGSDFPFSPTNQLTTSSSFKGNANNNNNHLVDEEAAGKKEITEAVSSPTYQKLADAVGRTSQYLSERAKPVIETLSEKAKPVIETLSEKAKPVIETLTNTIAANTIVADEQAQSSTNYATQNSEACELISSAAECVKDTTVDTAKKVGTFVEEKTIVAAEYSEKAAVEAKKVGSYVGEKAVVAKEVAVEAGINAVVFSEKVTVEAKDRAVVAGWGVAHYTVEVAGGAAGFIEGKAAAGNWGTVADYVKEKAAAAKDASASAEEYTARKKASAERGMEANKERLSSSDETSSRVDLGH